MQDSLGQNAPEDQIPQNPDNLDSRFPILKNPIVAIGLLLVVALLLLVPIFIFIGTGAQKEKDSLKIPQEQKSDPFAAPYVEDQLIVKYRNDYTLEQLQNLKKSLEDLGVVSQEKVFDSDSPRLKDYYVLKFKNGTDVRAIKEKIDKIPEIDFSGPNTIVTIQSTPDDPCLKQSGPAPCGAYQWDMIKIGMPNAWELNNRATNPVMVAVLDTGINFNHKDFSGRTIAQGRNFINGKSAQDDNGHGTHVSGTIGAVSNNSEGIAGINWNNSVSLLPVKVLDSAGHGDSKQAADGIRYAVDQKAKVINMSFGVNGVTCDDDAYYQDAIDYAVVDHNIPVIVAAGNADPGRQPINVANQAPASCRGVIVVGSTNQDDTRRSTSNFGAGVTLGAPGSDIWSTWTNPAYKVEGGTSMAAPHVAGIVAMLLSIKPGLSPSQIKSCLTTTADSYPSNFDKSKPIGAGRLNAFRVVNECSGLTPITPAATAPTATPTSNNNPGTSGFQYTIEGNAFIDANKNNIYDSGESPLAGVAISTSGSQVFTGTSDAAGKFKIVVIPGTYSIKATYDNFHMDTISPGTLGGNQIKLTVDFPFPPGIISGNSSGSTQPTAVPVIPTVQSKPKATPTPVKTYSCHEKNSNGISSNGIIIGDLECTPN